MCSGLAPYFTLRRHCSGYDINCQYRIHFKERIAELQQLFPTLSTFRFTYFPYTLPAIGKFHLPAHTSPYNVAQPRTYQKTRIHSKTEYCQFSFPQFQALGAKPCLCLNLPHPREFQAQRAKYVRNTPCDEINLWKDSEAVLGVGIGWWFGRM